MSYTCHSGGCPGSDMAWELIGKDYGVETVAYSFKGHQQEGKNPRILTGAELDEGFDHVLIANKNLKRYPQGQSTYVKSLLSRNWFQVKNSEAVLAIGMFIDNKRVKGGTGWAVQMAIDNKKPAFVFDQVNNRWNTFNYEKGEFDVIDYIPKLTENFAGVGTREINDNGLNAIKTIFKDNLSASV